MPKPVLDPSPRRYATAVTLVKRSARGLSSAPSTKSVADIESWLLQGALAEPDLHLLFESFAWRLVAAGVDIERASLHVARCTRRFLDLRGIGAVTTACAMR